MLYAAMCTGHGEHVIMNQVSQRALRLLQAKGFLNEASFVQAVKASHYPLGLITLMYDISSKKATVNIIQTCEVLTIGKSICTGKVKSEVHTTRGQGDFTHLS